MKNKVVAMFLVASMALAMAGCGGKETATEATTVAATASTEAAAENTWANAPEAYLSGITAADYVDLPQNYKELTVEAAPVVEVLDENVEDMIKSQLDSAKTLEEVTGRDTVQDGDVVNIDYVGKKDGEEFDGGSAQGYDLTIGSGSFIDGFESGLIDAKVGDTIDLDLTFPENYGDTTLAGQAVVFTVTINKIQQYVVPELTNEYVAGLSLTDDFGNKVGTVDEFRTYVRNYLTEQNQNTYRSAVQSGIMTQLESGSTFKQDVPEAMVERYYSSLVESLTYQASQYGTDLETLMQLYGYTADNYQEGIREEAKKEAQQIIILQAIADAEKLNKSEEDFQATLEQAVSTSSYYNSVEDVEKSEVESYREYLMRSDVLNFLMEKTTVVAPADNASTGASAEAAAE